MFRFLRRKSSQISSHPILERGIDAMVVQRNAHLAEMNRLEAVIAEATRAYDQHTRLYDALNNSLFTINHPFDPAELEADISAAFDVDPELSVDQPSDEEREAKRRAARDCLPLGPAPTDSAVKDYLNAAAPHIEPHIPAAPIIPLRGGKRRKATAAEAAE